MFFQTYSATQNSRVVGSHIEEEVMKDPSSSLDILRQQFGVFSILFHQVQSARSAFVQLKISINQ